MLRTIRTTVFLTLVMVSSLAAHEKGAIRLANKEVAAGGELVIRGEKLPKSNSVILTLKGALETHSLGEVATTAAGTFEARLKLPVAAKPGAYVVLAEAGDGDELARADVVVTAAAMAHDMAGMTHEPDSAGAAQVHPTAEMMKLDVTRSGAEWGAIVLILALTVGGGITQLASARHTA